MSSPTERTATPTAPEAFLGRLITLAPYLGIDDAADRAAAGSGPLLAEVARRVRADGRHQIVWLAIAVLTGGFPTQDEVLITSRALVVSPPALAHRVLMEAALRAPVGFSRLHIPIDIVEGGVIVDVDFCATHLHNTGIQRVVRQTMKRWQRQHDILLVAWNHDGYAMRTLDEAEHARVVDWGGEAVAPRKSTDTRIVVPFRSTVILPEVPQLALCAPLAGLAQYSNNVVGMIGYDAIPVLSADTVPHEETDRFGAYLTIVKHSDVVAGISDSAAVEFSGFVEALGAQGLRGPRVEAVSLPVDAPDSDVELPPLVAARPSVLCVGSQEPRKNQLSVLFAAEQLWREGVDFSLTFIGGGSKWFTRIFDARVAALRRRGRAVEVRRGVSDAEMLQAYRSASFTVFPSYHEGYGLPVAESLVLGVPVITTNYGSTAEIARDGGCLVIDPRDDSSLISAMRQLLTEPAVRERLVAEIAARPTRTWDDYSDALWSALAGSEAR